MLDTIQTFSLTYVPFRISLQEKYVKSFKEMVGVIRTESRNEASRTSVINETAVIATKGLVNIIRAASDSARVNKARAAKDSHLPSNETKGKVMLRRLAISMFCLNVDYTMIHKGEVSFKSGHNHTMLACTHSSSIVDIFRSIL